MTTSLIKISRDGKEIGEYTLADLGRAIRADRVRLSDYYWRSGMTDWESVKKIAPRAEEVLVRIAALNETPPPPGNETPPPPITRPKAYKYWLIAAFLIPVFFVWRIIFDKSLGYSRNVKIFYAIGGAVVMWCTFVEKPKEERINKENQVANVAARKANPYAVSDNQENPMNGFEVLHYAEKLVKESLKSPSTAKFSGYLDRKTRWKKTYDNGDTQFYVVAGWVDSQNAFGAMLRSSYLVCFSARNRNVQMKFVSIDDEERGEIPEECSAMFR